MNSTAYVRIKCSPKSGAEALDLGLRNGTQMVLRGSPSGPNRRQKRFGKHLEGQLQA